MAEDKPVEQVPKTEEADAQKEEVKAEQEILNQNEKKCRKALSKLGLKQMDGFTRIALRKRDGVIFVMNNPDVFKSSESSYCCFGELKIEDPNQRMATAEAKKFQEEQKQQVMAAQASMAQASEKPAATAEASNEEAENEEGLTASHIDMVMNHASCSRNEAVRALRAANDDMIAAVMQLTQ